MDWRSPPLLLAGLAFLAAATFALRSGPPAATVTEVEAQAPAGNEEAAQVDAILYLVGEELVRPVVRAVAAGPERTPRPQTLVEALVDELRSEGHWPAEASAPLIFDVVHERDRVAVLDLEEPVVPPSLESERRIVASFDRTLQEAGFDRVAYLRDGVAGEPWLGALATPSSLE